MNPDFHPIVNGMYILLAVQLFLIACVRIFSKTENRLPLALLCLVSSEWFFRRFFWDVWPNYDLLIILIGGYKELFIGPLLYLHFKLKVDNKNVKLVASHLSLPIVVLTIYVVLRLFFYEGIYDETKLLRYRLHMSLLLFSYGTYFILSLKAIKNLKGIFLPRSLEGKVYSSHNNRLSTFNMDPFFTFTFGKLRIHHALMAVPQWHNHLQPPLVASDTAVVLMCHIVDNIYDFRNPFNKEVHPTSG